MGVESLRPIEGHLVANREELYPTHVRSSSPQVHQPQLLKQQIHQPKNKMQTLLLVNKIKDNINQEMMMVLHQVMSKIKFMKMSNLKKLSKLKTMIKTGIQMIRLIK